MTTIIYSNDISIGQKINVFDKMLLARFLLLNPLRGSFSLQLRNHGFYPWLLLFNPLCGLEECTKDINNNRSTNPRVQKQSSPECPKDINNNSPVQSSGVETSVSTKTPKWVERLKISFSHFPETRNYSKFNKKNNLKT